MAYISPALNVMIAAARKAGRPLIRDFGELENLQISMKGPADFVTSADKRTEKILIEELTKARPGYGFLGEEGGAIEGRRQHPPLHHRSDRRHHQLHARHSAFRHLHRAGARGPAGVGRDLQSGHRRHFIAEKGHGAYLNNKRLRVAARKELAPSVIATGLPFLGKEGHARASAEMAEVMNVTAGIRRFGSASLDLAYVAAGRFDGFWERGLSGLGHRGGHRAGARGGRRDHRSARRRRDADPGHGAGGQ